MGLSPKSSLIYLHMEKIYTCVGCSRTFKATGDPTKSASRQHELAKAFAKIDGGKGGSYEQGHNAALQREMILRDQRPYLKQYNTGAGGPANSPNPQGGIIIKR